MSERKAGYYWVRHRQFHDWHIGEKTAGGGWLLTGLAMPYGDGDMDEIGPRIPTPDDRDMPREALEACYPLAIAWAAHYQFMHGLDDFHEAHAAAIRAIRAALKKCE